MHQHYQDLITMSKEHQQQLLEQGEKHRLIAEIKATQRSKQMMPLRPVMLPMGDLLIRLGKQLKTRYAAPAPAPYSNPCADC